MNLDFLNVRISRKYSAMGNLSIKILSVHVLDHINYHVLLEAIALIHIIMIALILQAVCSENKKFKTAVVRHIVFVRVSILGVIVI